MTDPYPFSDDGVTAALDALGNDGAEVAEALRRLHIEGIQHDCLHCPGAMYLAGLYPDTDVHVDRSYVRLDRVVRGFDEDGHPTRDEETVRIDTPGPIVEFIAEFDNNQHRHLQRQWPPKRRKP